MSEFVDKDSVLAGDCLDDLRALASNSFTDVLTCLKLQGRNCLSEVELQDDGDGDESSM